MVVDEEQDQEEPVVVPKTQKTKSTSSLKKTSRSTSKLSTASSIDEAASAVAAASAVEPEPEPKKSLRQQSSRSKLKKKPTIEVNFFKIYFLTFSTTNEWNLKFFLFSKNEKNSIQLSFLLIIIVFKTKVKNLNFVFYLTKALSRYKF